MIYFTISNGDTEEYIRIEFPLFAGGDKFKALLETFVDKSARKWDSVKKCNFVHASVANQFIGAVKAVIMTDKRYAQWQVRDNRTTWESFEEFFETPAPAGNPSKTKQELLNIFDDICCAAKYNKPIEQFNKLRTRDVRFDTDLNTLKKEYRRAALALHPDRNDGDGSKMAELNIIWSELQTKF